MILTPYFGMGMDQRQPPQLVPNAGRMIPAMIIRKVYIAGLSDIPGNDKKIDIFIILTAPEQCKDFSPLGLNPRRSRKRIPPSGTDDHFCQNGPAGARFAYDAGGDAGDGAYTVDGADRDNPFSGGRSVDISPGGWYA